jgi:predicted enzyme related to lactoylglutathione lyase
MSAVGRAEGAFAWVGLASSDPPLATAFYAELFGWQSHEVATAMGIVTIFTLGGGDVAILYSQTPEARAARVAPHWTAFIAVRDAHAVAAEARNHGATVLREPFDVPDFGRVATLLDPIGAVISLWQPLGRPGAATVNALNAHCLTELIAGDLTRAKTFYGAVFGWGFEDDSTERTRAVDRGGPRVTMRTRAGPTPLPDGWLPYFLVETSSAVAATARRLGGADVGDAALPGSALLADPTGAMFAVLEA